MAILNVPTGNQPTTNFFQNATANRLLMVPAAAALAGYANKPLGMGTASAYSSRVKSSLQNGAGPAIAPLTAPWSFTQFATGKRILTAAIKKKLGK